jgi:hypothetical protein
MCDFLKCYLSYFFVFVKLNTTTFCPNLSPVPKHWGFFFAIVKEQWWDGIIMKFQTETVAMGVEKSRHFENVIRDEPEVYWERVRGIKNF